ncbi:uncharacterized protein [Anabrus simplex]|uniref:uncharacterized protein n=1 Tax=Anabrus simplex TaxID=316456 RepID=UPI0035A2737C
MEEVYTVKVRAQPDAARLYPSERRYSASTVGGLGAVHLALAATCILLAGLDMAQPADFMAPTDWTGRYGGGAWLGMAAALAGLTGILAWRRWYIDNNIRWFFICSCIAGITAVLCLVVTAAALAVTQEEWASTRLQVLSSLKEQYSTPLSLHFPLDEEKEETSHVDPTSSVSQNSELFEVQRSLRNAEISNERGTTAYFPSKQNTYSNAINITPGTSSQTQSVSHKHSDSQNAPSQADHKIQIVSERNEPSAGINQRLNIDPLNLYPNVPVPTEQIFQKSPRYDPHSSAHLENHDINENHDIRATSETFSTEGQFDIQTNKERHHVSVRQAFDEDQFAEGHIDERHAQSDEGEEHTINGDNTDALHGPIFKPDDLFPSALYLHRNNNDGTINEDSQKVSLPDNETDVNKSGQSNDKYVFHKHLLSSRGGETRFVIVINLLVASILEIAWSILSAKIAWKGMKSGYPEDGPPRTDTLQSMRGDEHSKEKNKTRSKKMGGLRKPDIISNHDGSKLDLRRKSYYKEERRDPSLPMQESPTEYQERVRRFLASNSLATVDGGMD